MAAGELQSVDGYMNIALERTAEYVSGQLRRSYGDAFVRGNNGLTVSEDLFEVRMVDHKAVMYICADA